MELTKELVEKVCGPTGSVRLVDDSFGFEDYQEVAPAPLNPPRDPPLNPPVLGIPGVHNPPCPAGGAAKSGHHPQRAHAHKRFKRKGHARLQRLHRAAESSPGAAGRTSDKLYGAARARQPAHGGGTGGHRRGHLHDRDVLDLHRAGESLIQNNLKGAAKVTALTTETNVL
eukprot:1182171-Prorocentrum_minimum.AAC.2